MNYFVFSFELNDADKRKLDKVQTDFFKNNILPNVENLNNSLLNIQIQ